ncbi:MAG: M24 family metallopeptidase [Promethearchaeota archaeon]
MFDFQRRLAGLQARLKEDGIGAALLLNTRNIYWISGAAQASQLIVPSQGDPTLLVRRNINLARKHSWFDDGWIKPLKSTGDAIRECKATTGQGNSAVGMELSGLPATYYFKFRDGFGSQVKIVNVTGTLRELRAVKDTGEIEILRAAGRVAQKTQEVVYEMTENFTPGTSEKDIAAEMVRIAKKNRAEHYSIYDNNMFTNFNNFFIVASGEALWTPSTFPIMSGSGFSPAIPYGPSDRVLQEGDMLVCDYGMIVDGYHADHARSFIINGVVPKYYRERYENLKLAYERTVDGIRAGQPVESIFSTMLGELKRLPDPDPGMKIERYFQGNGEYFQALGHGIGLELDEPPFLTKNNRTLLVENMVLSIEPKIIIPGWGAINFEDNFVIKPSRRPEQLTHTRYVEF